MGMSFDSPPLIICNSLIIHAQNNFEVVKQRVAEIIAGIDPGYFLGSSLTILDHKAYLFEGLLRNFHFSYFWREI